MRSMAKSHIAPYTNDFTITRIDNTSRYAGHERNGPARKVIRPD